MSTLSAIFFALGVVTWLIGNMVIRLHNGRLEPNTFPFLSLKQWATLLLFAAISLALFAVGMRLQ
jgi:hypothetical protein